MNELTHVTRITDTRDLIEYQPGEIGQPFQPEDTWFIACPTCGGFGNLSGHQVTINPDQTITIVPSILCYGRNLTVCAHYFVEQSQIRWV